MHGVLYVFCLIACDVSALRNLLYEFSLMFFMYSVIFFKLVLGHCFEGVLLDYFLCVLLAFFDVPVSRTVFYVIC